MTKTEGLTLELVVPGLGEAYTAWKEAEADKNARKDEFFALADEAIYSRGVQVKIIDVEAPSEAAAVERAKLHYSAWRLELSRPHRWKANTYEVILWEDQSYKPFSFEHEGIKYSRTVSKGPVMVDDDWLADDPELHEAVTFALPWGTIMRPLETLDAELIGRLSKYIYQGLPRVSLSAPRPVKTEDA